MKASKDGREIADSDYWQRAYKQRSFDLFLGLVQFCSFQAGTDSVFNIRHPKEKLVVFHVNLDFQDLESSNSSDVTAGLGRLDCRHIL